MARMTDAARGPKRHGRHRIMVYIKEMEPGDDPLDTIGYVHRFDMMRVVYVDSDGRYWIRQRRAPVQVEPVGGSDTSFIQRVIYPRPARELVDFAHINY